MSEYANRKFVEDVGTDFAQYADSHGLGYREGLDLAELVVDEVLAAAEWRGEHPELQRERDAR